MMVAEMKNDSFLPARLPAPLLSQHCCYRRLPCAVLASFHSNRRRMDKSGGSLRCATCNFFRDSIFRFRLARQKTEFDSLQSLQGTTISYPAFFVAQPVKHAVVREIDEICLASKSNPQHTSLSLSLSPWTETSEAHTTHIT